MRACNRSRGFLYNVYYNTNWIIGRCSEEILCIHYRLGYSMAIWRLVTSALDYLLIFAMGLLMVQTYVQSQSVIPNGSTNIVPTNR